MEEKIVGAGTIIKIKKYFHDHKKITITVGLTTVLTALIPTFLEAHLIAILMFLSGMCVCFYSLPR